MPPSATMFQMVNGARRYPIFEAEGLLPLATGKAP
jgi:hypothetical protein